MLNMAIDFTTARRQRRRGISLLEVLFAIFILAMGMLGLGALIPVGNYQVSQGLRMDHAAACGRAAFRQLEASEMLRPENWVTSGNTSPTFLTTNGPGGGAGTGPWPIFMLDPFRKTRGSSNAFPPDLSPPPPAPTFQMERVTLRGIGGTSSADVARADAIFRWHDDLPTNIDTKDATSTDRPNFASATTEWEGKYSWMAMIAPSPVENSAAAALPSGFPVNQRRQFMVSIIVCFDRDTGPETTADVEVVPTPDSFSSLANSITLPATTQSKIIPGQWIMLSHQFGSPGDSSAMIHRWYRVVNVGNRSLNGTPVPVRLQLAGPTFPDPGLLINSNLPQVTIVTGVIGVYERTIELDTNSAMSLPGA